MQKSILTLFFLIGFFFQHLSSAPDVSEEQKLMLEALPPDQRANILEKMQSASSLEKEIKDTFEASSSLTKKPELKELEDPEMMCDDCIFGYEYFKFSPSTFAPVDGTPISSNYILGPGDKLLINYYGNKDRQIEVTISREGNINLPMIGPLNFMGMSFDQAFEILELTVNNELIGTDVTMSLKQARSINVYLLGEAYKPGRYLMSGLSSVSNALFISGGVSKEGSLRNIEIKRDNVTIAVYDFYDFLLKGSLNSDIDLQDGDVIFIPFIERSITMGGAFKRPHRYEIKKGETVADAIKLAGGFTTEVIGDPIIEVSSINTKSSNRMINLIDFENDLEMLLSDGDVINTSSRSGLDPDTIKVTGEVNKPGEYSISPGETILDVINRAGGFSSFAYTEGAVFLRESVAESQKEAFMRSADALENTIIDIITKDSIQNITEFTLTPISSLITKLRDEKPLGRMVVDLDYLKLKTDPLLNFSVYDGDTLHIPKRPSHVSIVGEVLNSTTVGYNPNLTVFEYINLSGGLTGSADEDKIFIIFPNGKSALVKRSLFGSKNTLLPGSTVVISRDSRPFDVVNLTQIVTPILADLATSAAAIAAISD